MNDIELYHALCRLSAGELGFLCRNLGVPSYLFRHDEPIAEKALEILRWAVRHDQTHELRLALDHLRAPVDRLLASPGAPRGLAFSPIARLAILVALPVGLWGWLMYVPVSIEVRSMNASAVVVQWNVDGATLQQSVSEDWKFERSVFRYSKDRRDGAAVAAWCEPGDLGVCFVRCCIQVGKRQACKPAEAYRCAAQVDLGADLLER